MTAKIISFISSSGGVGKTKLSLLLAYYLKHLVSKILFIDMDPTAGASLLLLEDEEFDDYIENGKTFSTLIKRYLEKSKIEFDRTKITTNIGDKYIDLLIPGEDFIDYIGKIWETPSAGLRFRKMFNYIIPQHRYDYIIVDTAPFFDPRYTSLAIYFADTFIVPLRPSLIDLKRTHRMIDKIRDELEIIIETYHQEKDVETYMLENIHGVFNLVPTQPKTAERKFVEIFLNLDPQHSMQDIGTNTRQRVSKLLLIANRLAEKINFLQCYIKTSAQLERFPIETKEVFNIGENFLKETSKILEIPTM